MSLSLSIMKKPEFIYSAFCNFASGGDTLNVNIDLGFDLSLNNRFIHLKGIHSPVPKDPSSREFQIQEAMTKFLNASVQGRAVVIRIYRVPIGMRHKYGLYEAEVWFSGKDVNGLLRQFCLNEQGVDILALMEKNEASV